MDPHLVLDALRLVVAGYLVLLAICAWAGLHRPLLAYPFRAGYSTFRLLVLAGTFNRVKLVPLSRRARRSTQRRLRNWRFELQELKDRRAEERGDLVRERATWSSGRNAPVPDASAVSEPLRPAPAPPTPGTAQDVPPQATAAPISPFPAAYFDDEDDEDDEDELPPTPFFGR